MMRLRHCIAGRQPARSLLAGLSHGAATYRTGPIVLQPMTHAALMESVSTSQSRASGLCFAFSRERIMAYNTVLVRAV